MYLDKTEVEESVLDMALDRARLAFDRFDHIAVSFSGGKDSTCALNLALNEHRLRHGCPPGIDPVFPGVEYPEWDGHQLEVIFYDEEAIAFQTEDYVRRVYNLPDVAMRWFAVPFTGLNSTSTKHPWWWHWDPDLVHKWCRPLPPEAIITPTQAREYEKFTGVKPPNPITEDFPEYPMEQRPQIHDAVGIWFNPEQHGVVGYFMGIRADESMTRLRAVTRRKDENWIVQHLGRFDKGNVWKCYPIYDWKTADVWTAPARYGWDYNKTYDLQELHGFHGSRQRIAPPFGAEPMQMLSMWATCHPELWDKMVDRAPGVATAARYARTELYGFGGRAKPKRGESWEQLIVRLASKHHGSVRAIVKERLKDEIAWHYNKIVEAGMAPDVATAMKSHPILPTAPHPITGLSMQWLAMVAQRGDVKRRKVAGWELGENTPENRRKLWAAYKAEWEETQTAERAVNQ